jgi:hypothetical protein
MRCSKDPDVLPRGASKLRLMAPDCSRHLACVLRQPAWSAVRFWLLDPTEEIHAGFGDPTLPPLALDRVWITPQGRAVLLDSPSWGLGGADAPAVGARDVTDAHTFLDTVAPQISGVTPGGFAAL